MSVITRYILKEHAGPFVFSLVTIVFVFLLNLIFRDLGRLLGKGLPAGVVLEFFFLNLAWILALAIPMAVLVSTLMAFGRLSSDSEIAALKASGVHIYRLLGPALLMTLLLAVGMERFNNCVLPDFNHRVRLLTSAISRKRPTLTLEAHVFFDEIPNYSLLVREIEDEGNLLRGVIINDYSDARYSKTIIADRGQLSFSQEQERMVFTLFDGEVHEVDREDLDNYRRMQFERHVFSVSVPNMVLKRSESQHRGDREKSARMMRTDIDRNLEALGQREDRIRDVVSRDMELHFPEALWNPDSENLAEGTDTRERISGTEAVSRVRQVFQQVQGEVRVMRGYRRSMSALWVEIHKKYSIPVACIVFVLVGAPLGIMARQGGLAFGGGMSLVFFLIYWAFLIGGEQLADRQLIGPAVAMWSPNVVVGIGGVYLVIHSVREATFIPWDRWRLWFQKIGGRKRESGSSFTDKADRKTPKNF